MWCPNCQAKAGEPCTAPTDDGRRVIHYYHLARIDMGDERE